MPPRRYAFRKPWLRGAARALDAVGDLLLARADPSEPAVHDLVLVRLDQLGDMVQMLPLLDALRGLGEALRVDLITHPLGAEVVRGHPVLGAVHAWECPWYRGSPGDLRAWGDLVRLLRREGYQTVVDPRGDVRVLTAAWWAGVEDIVGFGATGGGFLCTRELAWDPEEHAVDRNLRVAAALGAPGGEAVPRWPTPAPTRGGSGKPYLAVHADAGTAAKRWPLESFAEVLRGLLGAQDDLEVVLVGVDPEVGGALRAALGSPRVRDRTGATTFAELVEVLAGAEGLLTNDSGPAHVAAALGTPVWVVWSGTAPAGAWRPRGERVTLFENTVPCAPCGLRVCPVRGHPCLQGIEPSRVLVTMLRDLEVRPGT